MKQILFFGSIWGIAEATLGWLLHFIHFPAGAIMFPLGIMILLAGDSIIPKRSVLLLIGVVAATFKMTNIFLFGEEFLFNQIISILMESAFVAIIAPYLSINMMLYPHIITEGK